ncbi:preprotein translocase subunit SecE [Flavobacterium croceum]|jgi:preprotein translocase subunit SecE|uniref:Protein translocase subunit SecE n=1 Tax=Flavobacterium croceum DSM 17960 TaxID=1121886 RepID=A0A2S4N524_9FLAO|nr:preprotein translocase subunit SecE [Flavobacterium croceum]POS00834.1 preprotein translocase subunit SecE [Flavobacterium croceum DSM 17960]
MSKIFNYFSEAFQELKVNVTWPTWAEVQKYTVIVALFSIVFALATWGVDELCSKTIAAFFNLIKG